MAMSIMIQGTMSNVGKSLITAGLCRIFRQDGYKCAPFKSQNMALNSFITKDGFEIGRAQAMQAEAAGIEPKSYMNPILLKPLEDCRSQVILNGEVLGNMSAKDYYKNKKKFIPYIMNSYNTLCEKFDIVVIEGAGSPAEINLNKDDIVNMGMARLARSPVLIVGDIDRGGVFAQLIGTVALLRKDEREFVKGLIVNKFRGNRDIFSSGVGILEKRSRKPVIGVVPYVKCDIDDEDSLSERFDGKNNGNGIYIAVVKLPRISNFTDFNAFETVDGVNLRYVESAGDFGNPDIIIIPGTKNTVGDLLWLRKNGIEDKIKQFAGDGKIVFGVCGGFQMLGKTIADYEGVERKGEYKGIGLLPVKTYFDRNKTRTRVEGEFTNIGGILSALSGVRFEGYEIHNGVSEIVGGFKNMCVLCNQILGGEKFFDGVNAGNVYGTYVHGIFDSENVIKTIVSAVMGKKGIAGSVKIRDMKSYKEEQFDLLADTLRQNIDINMVYKILREGM